MDYGMQYEILLSLCREMEALQTDLADLREEAFWQISNGFACMDAMQTRCASTLRQAKELCQAWDGARSAQKNPPEAL